ncbi:hypothetical protein LOTGIDRAFT_168256 [Lottia gigantea]|uniref:Fibrinogen C-terminal domain-containing protein n=1 Tax=Lottia gigantea TaxID=225164 RepID=V3ZR28_LOTGI|nr:hypothetical protein LOTGIDRAFT_168256 [Lottia gigantea]ESO84995.1 hypothetical protein LOTGIDRAFT_168256 [Lottia gigantea]
MEGGSALIGFLFALTSYYPCSGQGILATKFLKTSVIVEYESVRIEPMFTDPVIHNQECSQLCTRDYGCRKYMVATDITTHDKLCYRYSDGENCVASSSELSNKESVCYRKLKQSNGTHCVSPVGYYGTNCEYIIKDCYHGQYINFKSTSLSYVKPANKIFEVLCDFNNGMTNIQIRRSDSVEVNFNRTWNDYVNGFGNTHSEYWLGLQNIFDLTNNVPSFNLDITLNHSCSILYPNFKLMYSTSDFVFSASAPPSDGCFIGDIDFRGAQFVTYDRPSTPRSCALPQVGGWWYTPWPCTMNLNSPRDTLNDVHISFVMMRLYP